MRTHLIVLYVNGDNVTYTDSFGIKHIPEENTKFNRNTNTISNTDRIHVCNSIMCRYFCTGFIDFMLLCEVC